MTARQKIGQRIALGFSGTKVSDELRRLVKEYKVGNIILFKHNLVNSSQASALCAKLQELVQAETGEIAFIAIDQEGGTVARLPDDMVNVPGAMALAASGKFETIAACQITAAELKRIGVNLILAPVLDVNCNPDNPVIGNRSFSPLPEVVADFACTAIKAFEDEGLMCCGKHFPGHGDTSVDSHLDLPVVNSSLEKLEARELVPFRAAIKAGIPAIMTSHILFPQVEPERLPATMSAKILRGLLREKLGFQGLILSDAMEMEAIKAHYGMPKGCVEALAAGVDIIFLCHEMPEVEESLKAVYSAFDEGRFDAKEADASVERILHYKEVYAAYGLGIGEEDGGKIKERRELNAAITQSTLAPKYQGYLPPPLGARPFFIAALPFSAAGPAAGPADSVGEAGMIGEADEDGGAYGTGEAGEAYEDADEADGDGVANGDSGADEAEYTYKRQDDSLSFARWFAGRFHGAYAETAMDPDAAEVRRIVSGLPQASSIVMGTCNSHLNPGQRMLVNSLNNVAKYWGIPHIVLALRNPWDIALLPDGVYSMALWEYSEKSFEAAAAVFLGDALPTGRLP